MEFETLDRANKLAKHISGLQAEITIWKGALKFEDNVKVTDGHYFESVNISSDDFKSIKDYMLGKLHKRLFEAELQFANL